MSSKGLCDLLVVSVTADKNIPARKGDGRPVYPERLRAYALAMLEPVDLVVLTPWPKGVDVVRELKPSYYIKGPDFRTKQTPGITAEREAIKTVGGEMKYTDDPKLSTTEIIRYIKGIPDAKLLIILDRDGTLITNDDFFGKEADWEELLETGPEPPRPEWVGSFLR